MGVCSPRQPGKRAWKTYVAMAVAVVFAVAIVAVAVAVPTVLCLPPKDSAMAGNVSARLAQLEKELAVANWSLAKAHGQWDDCTKQLGVLEGKASELEWALSRVTQLQEENENLRAEVAQQQKQLKDLQSSRDEVQLQNQHLKEQLQDMMSQHSGGHRILAVSLSLLTLLPGMLLL